MLRKFRMVGNDNGQIIDLNNFDKFLLTLPTGLGIEFKNSYITVGNQRIRVAQDREYGTFTGTIEITGNTRNEWEINYIELRDFIAKNKQSGIRLYYAAVEQSIQNERYIDCDIKLIRKTEKLTYTLPIGVEFEPRTSWREDVELTTQVKQQIIGTNALAFMKDEDLDGTEFSHNYGFKLDESGQHSYKFTGAAIGEAVLINDSDLETPLNILIYGACLNPYIQLLDANNNIVQACRVYTELFAGDTLEINSDPADLKVLLRRENGNVNIITNSVDTSLTSFLTLPVGSYTLQVKEENEDIVNSRVRFALQFLGG